MYKFKTISVKDWEYAVDEQASTGTKTSRHLDLAFRALEEVVPSWFPNDGYEADKCEMSEIYNVWRINPYGHPGVFIIHIEEAKIWIVEKDKDGNKQYLCGEPDWKLYTNLAE